MLLKKIGVAQIGDLGGLVNGMRGEGGIHGGFKFIGARRLHFATFQHFD